MTPPRKYEGPFDPPPSKLLIDVGAIGWKHISESDPEHQGRWRPKGWLIITADSLMEVALDGTIYRDALLYAP